MADYCLDSNVVSDILRGEGLNFVNWRDYD